MRRMTYDRERVGKFVCERALVPNPGLFEAFGVEDEHGNLLGGAMYNEFNGRNMCVHIASESRLWVTKTMLKTMAYYPFVLKGVHRLTGYVLSTNKEAIRFDEHIGFRREAVLKEFGPNGEDLIVYVMFKEDCRFLEKFYGPEQTRLAA